MASKQASSAPRKKTASRAASASKAKTKKRAASQKTSAVVHAGRQLEAVLLFSLGILLTFAALIPGGSLWYSLHQLLFGLFSWCAYLIGPLLLAVSVLLSREEDSGSIFFRLFFLLALIALFCGAMHVNSNRTVDGSFSAVLKYLYRDGKELFGGGAVGMLVGYPLVQLFDKVGASICIYLLIFICLMLATGGTVIGMVRAMFVNPAKNVHRAYSNALETRAEQAQRHAEEEDEDELEEDSPSFLSGLFSSLFSGRQSRSRRFFEEEDLLEEENEQPSSRRWSSAVSEIPVSESAAAAAAKAVSQAASSNVRSEAPSFSDDSARSRLLNSARGRQAEPQAAPAASRTAAVQERQERRSFFDFDQRKPSSDSTPSSEDEETLAMAQALLAGEDGLEETPVSNTSSRIHPNFTVSKEPFFELDDPTPKPAEEPVQASSEAPRVVSSGTPMFEGEDDALRYMQNLSRVHMVAPEVKPSSTPIIRSSTVAAPTVTTPDFPVSSYAFADSLRSSTESTESTEPTVSFSPHTVEKEEIPEEKTAAPAETASFVSTPAPAPIPMTAQVPEPEEEDEENEPEEEAVKMDAVPEETDEPAPKSLEDLIRLAAEAQHNPPPSLLSDINEPEEEDLPEETAEPAEPELPLVAAPTETAVVPAPTAAPVAVPAVEPAAEAAVPEVPPAPPSPPPYVFPPIDLLAPPKSSSNADISAELRENADQIIDTLHSFNIQATIINVTRGPTVTRYEIQPGSGVKISKIVNLEDDLALSLAAPSLRIEAPIPGKRAIGIEVPNKTTSVVPIRDIIDSDEFTNAESKLTVSLGKDISGAICLANIAKMPHLLIAGTTGSGKSVCINSFIISLLYKARPDEVKLLMIDPKVVELSVYNGIPHLIAPVVTDSKKAAGALCTMVAEMERRYNLFAQHGVRNLKGFNELVKKSDIGLAPMPHIVIIIDELADLMMTCPKDVEDYIRRLTQKARAAGMYLIVATQRPSVDVITGVIKSNIPSRISFSVSSQIDSRTILDIAGAEKLLGRGDMLFKPNDCSKPPRIQGCFVDDFEVENVVDFIKQHSSSDYSEELMNEIDQNAAKVGSKGAGSEGGSSSEEEDNEDELLNSAIELVVESGQASTSYLQRRLNVGYGRAARLIDSMEHRGLVGPPNGSKPRVVQITRDQWYEMKNRMS